jgi:DNA polymerase-3 subunit epsilon
MVRNAPIFAEICDQLLGVLDGRVFVAHNANFDWRFLSMEIERATRRTLSGRRLCTVRMARKLRPGLRRRSLD